MEWLTSIRTAIRFMEDHLQDDIGVQDVADKVYLSPFFLQKGFSLMTGVGIGEYIRNRKLYQAALDLIRTDDRIIDIAQRYSYETPESFTKAFIRFHGASPSHVRAGKAAVRPFLPLTISISIQGGEQMNYTVAEMFPFRVIGFMKEFSADNSYTEIPKFWDEICSKYAANVYAGNEPKDPYEKAVMDYCIGEYGICIDDIGEGKFRYLIVGKYTGGEVPEGMTVYEFPRGTWAVFNCIGPVPETLQSMNTRIFTEWLPGNPEYEISGNANVEWYDCVNGEKGDADYHSAVWIPVKRRTK